ILLPFRLRHPLQCTLFPYTTLFRSEGTRERIQVFEGIVIKRQNGGIHETFTVRKISYGVGVERTFPLHSPRIAKIEVTRRGIVRRAKLYYIRNLQGKAAR